jgi:hypothetical protein
VHGPQLPSSPAPPLSLLGQQQEQQEQQEQQQAALDWDSPSERVFSVAGLIVNKARNNLQEANVGMLVFLRNVFAFEKRYGIVL